MDKEEVKQRKRIAELLTKKVRKTITSDEEAELNKWVGDREDRKKVVKILTSQSQATMDLAIKKFVELLNDIVVVKKK